MFYIYANGKSIYQPMDNSLSLISPKLTLEMGKAGSLQFQIPPSNKYYNALNQLTTVVTVELDDVEIFRGRVLTNNRSFNKVRTIYCEGNLAYLVDSVQKGEKSRARLMICSVKFWLAGAEGLILGHRRPSVRTDLTAHRAVIHSRPFESFRPLNELKKQPIYKIDCFFNGRGRRTRTLNKGFGDPRVTITPYP